MSALSRPRALVLVTIAACLGSASPSPATAGHLSPSARTDGPWTYKYGIAHTDGLYLQEVKFNSKLVLAKISLVQIEVEYTEPGEPTYVFYDELGNGEATAGSTLYPPSGPLGITSLADGGVKLSQEFRLGWWEPDALCQYRYVMEYWLHGNGDIKPWVITYGPGCHWDYTGRYHFFYRADFDIRGGSNDKFAHWHTTSWEVPSTETANPHHDDYNNRFGQYNGPEWQTWEPASPVGTYNFDPFTYDTTELWILQFDDATGAIGHDLAAKIQPGVAWHVPPDLWSNNESVQNADIVHWYAIHATRLPGYGNGACWPMNPCVRGPDRFNPTGSW